MLHTCSLLILVSLLRNDSIFDGHTEVEILEGHGKREFRLVLISPRGEERRMPAEIVRENGRIVGVRVEDANGADQYYDVSDRAASAIENSLANESTWTSEEQPSLWLIVTIFILGIGLGWHLRQHRRVASVHA